MIYCAITTHTDQVPAVCYATVDGVELPRCQMHIARARRDGCIVRLRPLQDLSTTAASIEPPEPAPQHELVLPAPTPSAEVPMSTADTPKPKRVHTTNRNKQPTNRHLPLVLRPDADLHPDLCRVAECTGDLKGRGCCGGHQAILREKGDTVILLPTIDPSDSARRSAATRVAQRAELATRRLRDAELGIPAPSLTAPKPGPDPWLLVNAAHAALDKAGDTTGGNPAFRIATLAAERDDWRQIAETNLDKIYAIDAALNLDGEGRTRHEGDRVEAIQRLTERCTAAEREREDFAGVLNGIDAALTAGSQAATAGMSTDRRVVMLLQHADRLSRRQGPDRMADPERRAVAIACLDDLDECAAGDFAPGAGLAGIFRILLFGVDDE